MLRPGGRAAQEPDHDAGQAGEGRASLRSCGAQREPATGKSTKELLGAYEGKEEDLIKNLKRMESKQENKDGRGYPPAQGQGGEGKVDCG